MSVPLHTRHFEGTNVDAIDTKVISDGTASD